MAKTAKKSSKKSKKKSAKKKSAKKKTSAASSPTRCEDGGPELLPILIQIRPADVVTYRLWICKANARVLAFIDHQLLIDETSLDEVSITLPELALGDHLLYWNVLAVGEEWQKRAEVLVDDIVRFRLRKSSEGNNPTGTGFAFLRVLP